MTKGGNLQYKCRNCGKVCSDIHVPDVMLALICITRGENLPSSWGGGFVGMTELHRCQSHGYTTPDSIGIADLIGGEKDR